MEINKEVFTKYDKINIDDINKFENFNFIDKYIKQWIADTDDMYYKFLTANGYKIDKPYNMKQLKAIKEELEKQDKFIDTIEWIEYNEGDDCYSYIRHIIPFFNSINNPLSEITKQELLEKWKEKNGYGKRNNG